MADYATARHANPAPDQHGVIRKKRQYREVVFNTRSLSVFCVFRGL
jgi:hypothetical protein